MDLPRVTTKITALGKGEKSYEAVFLVDTGATDSMVPAPELEKIGLRREGKMAYELADGQVREYAYGLARIQFMDELTAGRVIFGEPDCEPLRGDHGRPGQPDAPPTPRHPLEVRE